jgi:hypothetical protein
MAGSLRAHHDAVSSPERMILETDESNGPFVPPLLVLFWTHTHVHRNHHYVSLSLNHLAALGTSPFSPLNPSNICDCSPWPLEMMRQRRALSRTKFFSARLLRKNAVPVTRSPQDDGKLPMRLATHPPPPLPPSTRFESGYMGRHRTGRCSSNPDRLAP